MKNEKLDKIDKHNLFKNVQHFKDTNSNLIFDTKLNDWPMIKSTLYYDQKLIDLLNEL